MLKLFVWLVSLILFVIGYSWWVSIGFLSIGLFICALITRDAEDKLISKIRYNTHICINEHLDTLARKRMALLTTDDYGVFKDLGWKKEVRYFVDKVLLPNFSEKDVIIAKRLLGEDFFILEVEDAAAQYQESVAAEAELPEKITPLEFEAWCAQQLGNRGWRARTTTGSGDQGADVLAEKGARKLVLQCKFYNGSVGNKAVQEVFAAKQHFGCNEAAVVATGGFTSSAQQLARTTGVYLLLHTELSKLD